MSTNKEFDAIHKYAVIVFDFHNGSCYGFYYGINPDFDIYFCFGFGNGLNDGIKLNVTSKSVWLLVLICFALVWEMRVILGQNWKLVFKTKDPALIYILKITFDGFLINENILFPTQNHAWQRQ